MTPYLSEPTYCTPDPYEAIERRCESGEACESTCDDCGTCDLDGSQCWECGAVRCGDCVAAHGWPCSHFRSDWQM